MSTAGTKITPQLGHRHARVRAARDGLYVVVERTKPDGSLDWFTYHLTRAGAARAARRYEATGEVRGVRP